MVFLRALVGTARMIHHTPRLAVGLPPDDQVVLEAPDDRLGPALTAAGRGDHRPAARLLAMTREAGEWESRDHYTSQLVRLVPAGRSDWLRAWLSAAPRDPDAALLRAGVAVRRAEDRSRGEDSAGATKDSAALPLVEAAAEASPRDPVPWRLALDRARSTGAPPAEFESYWSEAVKRAPHHYGCHLAALRYRGADCPAAEDRPRPHLEADLTGRQPWSGGGRITGAAPTAPGGSGGGCPTRHDCLGFAERAAEQALPGSLLRALPLRAVFHHLATVPVRRTDAAADLAIALSSRYAPGDLWPAEARNLLVFLLIHRGRWQAALDQFRLLGPCATAFPWNRISDDPLGQFLEARDGTRIQVAAMTPLRPARSADRQD
ncbi:hypothetical protein [Streptomyces sp. TP-A0874]|uniref:hypothetical protein n=1 Tax=Streptomyces sp. TP-A0874 TaxID=549819 RepID=UPI000852D781|nr:hypothetical protein [Streptomyces sp. TP-A0874]